MQNKNSTIFTNNKDILGNNNSIGLFGKSLDEIKGKIYDIQSLGLKQAVFDTSKIDTKAIIDYNEEIQKGTSYQEAMALASKNTNKETIALIESAKGAIVTTEELSAAQKASTLAAKAQSVAYKAVSMAGNMLVMALVTKGIELAASAIDHFVNKSKYAAEAMEEAQQEITDSQNKLKEVSDTVSENKDRFLELAQGVDQFSNNVSLSKDDYQEYLDISNKLADIAPDLVTGYDEQGNALLSIGSNAQDTSQKLQDVIDKQQAIANQKLVDNLPDIAEGIYNEVEDTKAEIDSLQGQLEDAKNTSANLNIDIKGSHGKIDFKDNDYEKYGKGMEKALKSAGIDYEKVAGGGLYETSIQLKSASKEQLEQAQKFYDAWLDQENTFNQASINGLEKSIAQKQGMLKQYYAKITPNLQQWAKQTPEYEGLGQDSANIVDKLIPQINWDSLKDQPVNDSDYTEYIENNIIKPLMAIPDEHKDEINSMFQKLLSFDDGDLNVLDFAKQLQEKLNDYGIKIDITPIIANEQNAKKTLSKSLDKISGTSWKDQQKLNEYTKDFNVSQIEAWNSATIGAKSADEAIQSYEQSVQQAQTDTEELGNTLADINKTKSGIGGLFDKYEQNEGYLTQDEVASVLETNPEYVQYLVKVGNQYKLNEQALNDWNEANKEQEQEINNQMGGNDYLSNYSPLLDSIQNNASHPNGGVGNTNIGSQLDDLINKNKEWNTSLQNGEITTAQYFQNMSNAITNSGLEDALHSLNGTFDDSTDYIEETVSVLATQLSDGLTQSTKRFEEGQTSVQDYIEEINAGSDAEKKLLASTYDLNISQETGKASLDGLSGSALEAAQSYNSLVDSQNALASTSGFVDVLSQNAEFLSQYTDEAGNLMNSIFDDSRFNDYVSNMSNSIVDFANQNTTTMGDVANWLAETAGISTDQATSIIAQGGEAVQEAVGGSLNGVQSMTSFAMSQVGTAAGNAASAVGNVLSSLGKMISSFSYKITATPFIKGKSKFDWDPKKGLDVSLPTFGFDIKGSGGKSVQSFSASLGKAGEALNSYGASQSASAAFNNINSYKPKSTLSANKPSSYRPTYTPKSSGKSGSGSKSPKSGSGSGSGSEKEPTKKDYDWIETLISRINRQVTNLGKTVSATYKTWSTRNNALAQELGAVNQQISAEQQAYNKYMQLANSVGLPEGYASLVRNGTIDVSTIQDDDLNDKIEKYRSYYESALSASDAIQDLQDKLAELAKTKFDNISSDFEAQIDQIKHSTTMYQSYIDQVEAEDAIPVRSYYENMIANEQQTIGRLKDEYTQLTNAMNEALNTGRIQAYSEEWYNMRASINSVDEAIQDANKSIIEYTKSMKELSKTKFDKISTAYENASGFNDHAKNMYNGLIDQADAEGRFASKDYYSALIDMEKLNIKTLTQESNDLHKSLQEAMNKGDIEEYSDDWYEMMGKINDVDEAIMDANKSLTEYGNSMRQLDWNLFDKQEDYISKIQEESDFLVDLMSNQTLYDKDTGKDTKYATAIKGLHVVNYDVYKAQAQDYAKEIEKINKDLADDPNNMKLIERKQELIKAQQDAITNANNERDAIKSLIKDSYDAQLDALQKLIEKYKDSLQATKDLYDYEKNVKEQTDNLAALQKQRQALGGDNSEETQSKIQQLDQQIKDAKSDLKDTEYQQYLSDQEQLLDTFYDETEEWLNSRLDDLDGLIQQVIDDTNANSGNIAQTITDSTNGVGYTLTGAMATIWGTTDTNLTNNLGSVSNNITGAIGTIGSGLQNIGANTNNAVNGIKGLVQQLVDDAKKRAEAEEAARKAAEAAKKAAEEAKKKAEEAAKQKTPTVPTGGTPSGGGGNNGGGSPSSGGSSSGGNSGGGNGAWGSWFIHQADSYPKNRLDINNSVVDKIFSPH